MTVELAAVDQSSNKRFRPPVTGYVRVPSRGSAFFRVERRIRSIAFIPVQTEADAHLFVVDNGDSALVTPLTRTNSRNRTPSALSRLGLPLDDTRPDTNFDLRIPTDYSDQHVLVSITAGYSR